VTADVPPGSGNDAGQAPLAPDAAELATLRELRAVVSYFADTWAELLRDLPDSYDCHMNCAEANAAADLYRALADDATAAEIIAAHAGHDEDGDQHYHGPAGSGGRIDPHASYDAGENGGAMTDADYYDITEGGARPARSGRAGAGQAADALRRAVEARIALWRQVGEATEDLDDLSADARDAIRACAYELTDDLVTWQEQARDFAVPGQAAGQPLTLRALVTQVARELRREADGIEADQQLNTLARRADAGARRTAAARIEMAIEEEALTSPAPAGDARGRIGQALAEMRRMGDAMAPSRARRVRAALDQSERLIREAYGEDGDGGE
jgi:hypothetical protein